MPPVINALSIDIEDWYHPELVRRHVPEAERTPRLRGALDPILDLLEGRNVRATFFLLGDLVQREPDLVRTLHAAGHEIGCHGMTHLPLWELSPEAFREELRAFRAAVAAVDATIPLRGYRAPTFSLDPRTSWALQIIADEGFTYDSSIYPFKNHVYGVAGAPVYPYRPDPTDLTRHSDTGPVFEFPLTVATVAGARLPVSGGFYLRALPYPITAWALRRVNRDRPFVLYGHPWEFDPETPRRRLGLLNNWITYTGIRGARGKLTRLLDAFPCSRLDEVVAACG